MRKRNDEKVAERGVAPKREKVKLARDDANDPIVLKLT